MLMGIFAFIVHFWWLFSLVALCIAAIIYLELTEQLNKGNGLSVKDAIQKVNDEKYVFVDLRDSAHFEKCHIPGAIHISKIKSTKLTPIFYCDDAKQSANESKAKQSFYLLGGIQQWVKSDMPVKEKSDD
ncbi:MAG: hypothetical protein CMF42_02325 [Legionellales bacterium]|nr:hypothetical protein [Legionellales bacterium]